MVSSLHLILGNQLFPKQYFENINAQYFFMAESKELCTYYKFHKQKLVFFLSSMRQFKIQFEKDFKNKNIHYIKIENNPHNNYLGSLEPFIKKNNIKTMSCYEIADKFFEQKLIEFCHTNSIALSFIPSPYFLCSRTDFKKHLSEHKKPFMKNFYQFMRKNHNILMEDNNTPLHGKFSFDSDNRKKLPKNQEAPPFWQKKSNSIDSDVIQIVEKYFPEHPGSTDDFIWATNPKEAEVYLKHFLNFKLQNFGDYQDAIDDQYPFLFHSTISPYINNGLLLPKDVLNSILLFYKNNPKTPFNNIEGFVRQLIGWREFINGVYQEYSEPMENSNFWNHERTLGTNFLNAETNIPPIDDCLKKAQQYGYNHHIERLMLLGNFLNLCEVNPKEVHKWFMEMYVDSSDWVMGPNVYGMALFSDGGTFATKPYICASNYILKMSHYKKGPWCNTMDNLFWHFIEKNKKFLSKNYRLSMMVRILEKKSSEVKTNMFNEAIDFKNQHFPLK